MNGIAKGLLLVLATAVVLYVGIIYKNQQSTKEGVVITPPTSPKMEEIVKDFKDEKDNLLEKRIADIEAREKALEKANVEVKVVEQPPTDVVVVKTPTPPLALVEEYSLVPTKFSYGGTTTVADKNLSDLKIMWMVGTDKNVRFPYFLGSDGKSHILHHTDGRSQPGFDPEPGHVWIPVTNIDMVPGPYHEAYQKAPEAFWAIVPTAIATKDVAQAKPVQ